jgi:CO/xanthine dehydrogenase Mo-binding subunit
LQSGTVDLGSGQITTLCQIAAEELGLKATSVRMVYSDTNTVPFDAPTHASRGTYSSGLAVQAAAADAKNKLLEVAAFMMEADAADLDVKAGRVFLRNAPETSRSVAEVVQLAESPFMVVGPEGPQPSSPPELKGSIMGSASLAPPENPSPATALYVEVEVDTETGVTSVLHCVYAHDLGRLINPNGAEGQVEGGMQQGIGYALMENLVFDEETGACLASDFLDYKMPTAMEMPRKIESIFIETDEPTGPFGAKSLSEQCVTVPAAAIAAAVYNATGVRVRELPITPEKILRGLGTL